MPETWKAACLRQVNFAYAYRRASGADSTSGFGGLQNQSLIFLQIESGKAQVCVVPPSEMRCLVCTRPLGQYSYFSVNIVSQPSWLLASRSRRYLMNSRTRPSVS